MSPWFKVAFRNILKNRRRSIITLFSIAFGFAGVNLFGGFTEYMYTANRETAIFVESRGHLTIFKKGFLQNEQSDSASTLLNSEEIRVIESICRNIPHVILVTPQLHISGLISNGQVSTIFIAQGIVPSTDNIMLSRITVANKENIINAAEGTMLRDDNIYGVAMSRGLARLLDLSIGSNAVAFSGTASGQMNALDLEIFRIFDGADEAMNDKFMQVPFRFAQILYDWDGADRLSVLLDKTEHTNAVLHQLQTAFSERDLQLEIKTWKELSEWYRKVKDMFDTIFIFLFVIVFLIVVMSVVNTMSMVIFERTREIGTLRALGLKRNKVLLLFGIESSLLGILGTLLGSCLIVLSWWLIQLFDLTWVPPGLTIRIPIIISFVPETFVFSFFFLLLLSLTASLIPAKRAARQNVVDALGYV